MNNRIVNLIGAAAVCLTFAATSPGEPPHSKQGDVRFIGTGRMGLPVWLQQPGESDFHYFWRQQGLTSPIPRFSEPDAPGDVDDAPPADGPANPCPNGDC